MRRLAQGRLDTKLGGAGDRTGNLPVTSRPALPPAATCRPLSSMGWGVQSPPGRRKISTNNNFVPVAIKDLNREGQTLSEDPRANLALSVLFVVI